MATHSPKRNEAVESDEPRFIPRSRVCELLGNASITTVYRLGRRGEIRAAKMGRKTVYEYGSVLAYMKRVLSAGVPDVESPIAATARAAIRARRAR